MTSSEQQKVIAFIDDIQAVNPEHAEIIESIRDLFNTVDQELAEEIKYGGLVFLKSDVLIGGIFPYKNHISIEFSNGTDFTDPHKLLEGKGNKRRHLKIRSHEEIVTKNANFFIKQSIQETPNS